MGAAKFRPKTFLAGIDRSKAELKVRSRDHLMGQPAGLTGMRLLRGFF